MAVPPLQRVHMRFGQGVGDRSGSRTPETLTSASRRVVKARLLALPLILIPVLAVSPASARPARAPVSAAQKAPAPGHLLVLEDARGPLSVETGGKLRAVDARVGAILARYDRVLVPEMNLGQLSRILRAEYLVDAVGFNRVRGLPLPSEEIFDAINQLLGSKT